MLAREHSNWQPTASKGVLEDIDPMHQTSVQPTASLDADKNYDRKGLVAEKMRPGVTPPVAQYTARSDGSAIDSRSTRNLC
jgi:hypothetical protein